MHYPGSSATVAKEFRHLNQPRWRPKWREHCFFLPLNHSFCCPDFLLLLSHILFSFILFVRHSAISPLPFSLFFIFIKLLQHLLPFLDNIHTSLFSHVLFTSLLLVHPNVNQYPVPQQNSVGFSTSRQYFLIVYMLILYIPQCMVLRK